MIHLFIEKIQLNKNIFLNSLFIRKRTTYGYHSKTMHMWEAECYNNRNSPNYSKYFTCSREGYPKCQAYKTRTKAELQALKGLQPDFAT